jgi:hypothetical protein
MAACGETNKDQFLPLSGSGIQDRHYSSFRGIRLAAVLNLVYFRAQGLRFIWVVEGLGAASRKLLMK